MSDIIDNQPKRVPMGPLERMPASSERKCRYCKQGLGLKRNSEGLWDFVTAEECPYCRDGFAKAALIGITSIDDPDEKLGIVYDAAATMAYGFADAMMKTRGL